MDVDSIREECQQAAGELAAKAGLKPGMLVVIGCSSSEIMGARIGKGSSLEAAQAVYDGLTAVFAPQGIAIAAQCCEHLNRALIVERRCVPPGSEIVNVMPQPHAGGSFAFTAWQRFEDPVAVETIQADAGMDIGDTLIGMHLKRVAVPVRLATDRIGSAHLVCARTRPKYIGGPRAVYQVEEELR